MLDHPTIAIATPAALHGIHLEKYTTDDFWDLNVVETRNVYEAARELGIAKILLCSTMGVYGELVRMWGFAYWSIEKAKRVLGYRPATTSPSSSRP